MTGPRPFRLAPRLRAATARCSSRRAIATSYREQAQDLASLIGKVVRINGDGSIPRDNPFVGRAGARPEIWSYGHRNVQGAAIHPADRPLWTVEHGARGGDELNHPEAGKNYGWPVITYGVDYSGLRRSARARPGRGWSSPSTTGIR